LGDLYFLELVQLRINGKCNVESVAEVDRTGCPVFHVKSLVSTYILKKTTGCHDNSSWQHVYRV